MKLKLETQKLKEMVSRSVKGCSNDKLLPLTSLMAIQLSDNKLTLITTDGSNYLYVSEDKVSGDDFYVVVQTEQFAKLVSKTTSEYVSLELVDSTLKFKGNGEYSIELPLDEEGELIKYPDPVKHIDVSMLPNTDIHLSTIKTVLNTARSALAVDLTIPCYTGYYVGKNIVATDTYKVCGIDIPMFNDAVLISSNMMDLLDVLTDENITVYFVDDAMLFCTGDCVVYGKELAGMQDYQIDAINGLIKQEFDSSCKISKDELVSTLDRLMLFVDKYDKNAIVLTFTKDGLMISSKKSNGVEVIQYAESSNFKDFSCKINIEMLYTQVKSQASPLITVCYGEDNAIKIVDGTITQVIALLED